MPKPLFVLLACCLGLGSLNAFPKQREARDLEKALAHNSNPHPPRDLEQEPILPVDDADRYRWDFPAIIQYVDGDGRPHPVVGVRKNIPLIQRGKRVVEVDTNQFRFERTTVYQRGYIQVLDTGFSDMEVMKNANFFATTGEDTPRARFETRFRPNRSFTDLTAAVVAYRRIEERPDLNATLPSRITFNTIGEVEAGNERAVTLFADHLGEFDKFTRLILLFYDQGLPVRTNLAQSVYAYLRPKEVAAHRSILEPYLANGRNEETDRPRQTVLAFTPYLPEPLYQEAGPIDAKARFIVGSDGIPRDITIEGVEHAEARQYLAWRVAEWQFLPKLEAGRPVKETLRVPIAY
ncbi:MAG: hypothetical protein ACFE0O_02775 [Opitutales bacterium]